VETAMDMIVEWSVAYLTGGDIKSVMESQIASFLK